VTTTRTRSLFAALFITLSAQSALAADPYCRPRADGIDRFPKTTATCPDGYFASGRCCVALHKYPPRPFPRINGAVCPPGTFASGGNCVRPH